MSFRTVIGEIGGSSSRWALLEPDGTGAMFPTRGETLPGFNPVNGDAAIFSTALLSYIQQRCPAMLAADRLVIYAAGCGTEERRTRMSDALRSLWPSVPIEVDSDLMGAAIGLYGTAAGMVLILGTGMNAGWYDGTRLLRPMPSLGFILGDEGSGADIGRNLLQDAFYQRMPEHVRATLFGADGPDLAQVLDDVHRSPFPARALAARTALLAGLTDEPYVRELILSRFHALAELLTAFFTPEQRMQVKATGSVAWGFKELLSECLLERGMTLSSVERDPLPGLVEHHRKRT